LTPKKHHYVPECYLKAFTNSQKQLWRRTKEVKKASICTPAQVGYEIDINKFKTEEILILHQLSDPNHIEKVAFRRQENNYQKTLSKTIKYADSPFIVDNVNYHLLLETLLTIKRRNPQTRKDIIIAFRKGYNADETIPRFTAYLVEEAKRQNIKLELGVEERVKTYIETRADNPDWLHDMYLTGYLQSIEYDIINKMANQLFSLRPVVLHAPLTTQFITSDNPGFTKTGSTVLNAGGFGGLFELYFPLSPHTCLYLNSESKSDKSYIGATVHPQFISASKVSDINHWSKFVSNNKLLGNDKTILEMV
jgi:hypothetical protein